MTVKELLLQAIDISSEEQLVQALTFLQTLNRNTPMISDRSEIIEDEEPTQYRQAGSLQGKITMTDDFDAPLEDFKDYM
jgi:hypothetical protein